jgi:hypothetical protein
VHCQALLESTDNSLVSGSEQLVTTLVARQYITRGPTGNKQRKSKPTAEQMAKMAKDDESSDGDLESSDTDEHDDDDCHSEDGRPQSFYS